ncbi:MAG: hypothetical protein WHX52_18535 [Anaerolineae bacterium]
MVENDERQMVNAEWQTVDRERRMGLGAYLRRVIERPRGWALSYLLTTGLALGPALLMTLAWAPLTRHPLFSQILATRSVDALSDFVMSGAGNGGGIWGTLALLLAFPIWVLARLIWTWLEGGTLAEYAAGQPLSWRAFAQAGWRWFGAFLTLNLLGAVLVGGVGGVALLLAVFVYMRSPALGWVIAGAGLALAGLIATWTEVARAVALTQNQRGVFQVLGAAARAMVRQALPLAALVGGGLALYGLLYLAHRWLVDLLPLHWWLPTLLIQQAYTIVRLGIRLARQAGQVGLVTAIAAWYDTKAIMI